MKNNQINGSYREKSRHYRWMLPVIVFIMGLFSIGLMFFAENIGQQRRLNHLYSEIIHEIQLEISIAHLIIEEHIEGNVARELPEGLLRVNNASAMIQTLLAGGVTSYGLRTKPLEDAGLREEVKDLGVLVDSYREGALKGLEAQSSGIDLKLNAVYSEFLIKANGIDDKIEALANSNDVNTNRLFSGMIASWIAILSVAIAGLLFREHQKMKFEKAIVHAKTEWEHTFDVIPDLIAVIDKDHRITRVNKAMADKMGRKPREILGQKCHAVFHTSEMPVASCPHAKMMLDGKEHTLELYEKTLDAFYLVSVSPLYDDDGALQGCVHVSRDISEQKRTAEVLKVKESAIESSINPMGIGDLDGNITYVNQALVTLWGYSKEELLGKPATILGRSAEEVSEVLHAIRSSGLWTGERIARKKDGSLFPVELSAHLVIDNDGKPICIMASFTNITKRKKAEEELQAYKEQLEVLVSKRTEELASAVDNLHAEALKHQQTAKALQSSEQKFRELSQEFNTLLNVIPDRLVLMSPDLKVLWVNRVALAPLLKDEVDITDHYCYTLWHGQKIPCNDCPVVKSFSTGEPGVAEISTPDGRLWSSRAYPIKDIQGKVKSVMEVSTDITEKVLMQAQRMRANHLASIGELAAGVAHEINNPINGIINYAQILRNRTQEGSRERDVSERIIKEGERVAFIVKSLLSFARERKEEKVPVPVSAVLLDTLSLTEVHLKKNAIGLTILLPEGLPKIRAHPQQLQQVFLNIINNARYALNEKYPQADPDKVLIIRGEEKIADGQRYVCLVFEDHGTGIPKDVIEKAMNPFFTTKAVNIGTGLGLSISHGIISDHGGKIEIESREGLYTRVRVLLPAYEG
ncbi:MAG: hypothetical protein H6Q92_346 [Nitrospirae bacterium]|nr:hypothetical protein [Nitrospirota bacterium]